MNMAERYKQQLDKTNFKPHTASNPVEISVETNVIDIRSKLKKIETDTISKIKKTPYWSDYEEQAQENMIGKYFDSKIKREGTEYTKEERNMFVRNILDLIK